VGEEAADLMELHLVKQPGGMLRPANEADVEALQKVKTGAVLVGEFRQPRNSDFHRRYFALLNYAFEYWSPPEMEWRGIKAQKCFERFRRELTVLAGQYTVTYDLKGTLRLEPKSISFASMDEQEFRKLYAAVFDILWQHVLSHVQGMSRQEVERILDEMMRFE
jgi:hypothetical protein